MKLLQKHFIFFVLLDLFFLVGLIDIFNIDSLIYQAICEGVAMFVPRQCATFYDIPFWSVYLSLSIITVMYFVHGEVHITNHHLRSGKK